jgi:hypothetical protein
VQVALRFVVVPTVLLMTIEPMLEGVGERCMRSATEAELVEGVGHVRVRLE